MTDEELSSNLADIYTEIKHIRQAQFRNGIWLVAIRRVIAEYPEMEEKCKKYLLDAENSTSVHEIDSWLRSADEKIQRLRADCGE
jgi:hypothetical protein